MKSVLRVIMLAVFAGLCGLQLMAQDAATTAKSSASKAKAASAMPMPKPAPEMIKLSKAMSGSWTVSEKFDVSPMMPKGGTGKGMAVFMLGPGGLSMTEKYHSVGAMGVAFNGMGTFWWDPKGQVYRGVWCDNMTPNGCDASGSTKWEGDKLVGTMEGEMNGQKMTTRFTYSDFTPSSFVMAMESGADANSLKPMMTVTYSKAMAGTNAKETKP